MLCEKREDGFHFVGYFSKEKILHHSQNNLSCYVVMPSAQGGGYGQMLIEMSYALSMIEKRPGGPERPFSDLGHHVYTKFWTKRLVQVLLELEEAKQAITLK